MTLASVGPASSLQIAFEKLKRAANVEMTFVSYRGGAPAISTLLGEHVTSVLAAYSTVAGQLSSAKLRVLTVTTKTRIEPLPDVPTIAESGYNDYQLDFWLGLVAPAKTPKETTSRLAGWFTAAVQAPEVKAKLVAQGMYPAVTCGADFTVFFASNTTTSVASSTRETSRRNEPAYRPQAHQSAVLIKPGCRARS